MPEAPPRTDRRCRRQALGASSGGFLPLLLAALLVVPVAAPAEARDAGSFALYGGVFDVVDEDETGEAGIELGFRPRTSWRLEPVLGVAGNADEAVWAYAGVRRDFELGSGWLLAPGFAVALYEEGESKDLGSLVELRSSLEVARRLSEHSRLGLILHHMSNAGIDDVNPGSNSVLVVWRLDL